MGSPFGVCCRQLPFSEQCTLCLTLLLCVMFVCYFPCVLCLNCICMQLCSVLGDIDEPLNIIWYIGMSFSIVWACCVGVG